MSRVRNQVLHLPHASGKPLAPRGTTAVVVGGGIAGIAAATVLCERGVHVTLIERDRELGGRAAGFTETLKTGEQVELERGFHGIFRHYYNLRALLRRVDPELAQLEPLAEYSILGPGGAAQSLGKLGGLAPLRALKLAWQNPQLGTTQLPRLDRQLLLQILGYDPEQTYAQYENQTASEYLDALGFPERARRMLLGVFAHSCCHPHAELSAAELLMLCHFYFTANSEGLLFDVARQPLSTAIFRPFRDWLSAQGARVELGAPAHRLHRTARAGFAVEHAAGVAEGDLLVLALDLANLERLVVASPDIDDPELRARLSRLEVARPFAVLRLWLDRPLAPSRLPFAGTAGVGRLDSIALYDRFQDESAAWARAHGGSVVALHAYGVDPGLDPRALRADLIAGLNAFYPESRVARIVDERMHHYRDRTALGPGSYAARPGVETRIPGLALASDFTRVPFPCALLERAASSGMLAANTLLSRLDVAPEPLYSVPGRGLLAPVRVRGAHPSWSPSHAS